MRRSRSIPFVALLALGRLLGTAAAAAAAPAPASARSRAADARYCASLDGLIRFLRHAPEPSAFKSKAGHEVLDALGSRPPHKVASSVKTLVWSFTKMRDGGRHALTKAEDKAANDALFRVALYGATHCKQKLVKGFGSAMVRSRVDKIDARSSTTSTTTP
ncbi:MAG: hypothetical protein ACXVJA_01865 [Acidimicrobiia bacterium]